ncbi:MAG: transcription antitermination factor NusB [Deltaproteobacteria bacterium]|nr:transcription antitermination factor NusB [Deltaproteobacteria bacterium]
MTYSRRRARESALQILYGLDWAADDIAFAIDDYWSKFAGEKPDNYEVLRRHCSELVQGVVAHRNELDSRIQAIAQHWKLDRMSAVDRNLLRLAAFELLHLGDEVPKNVAINEAVEIAKKYGNEDSSAFVNGILDRLAHGRAPTSADAAAERAKAQRLASGDKHGRKARDKRPAKAASTPDAPATAAKPAP